MNPGFPVSLSQLLTILSAQISAVTGINSNYVFPSLIDELVLNDPPADCFITLKPKKFLSPTAVMDGAGLQSKWFTGSLEILIWFRLDLDRSGWDSDYLQQANSVNLFNTWQLLLQALEQWLPQDNNGNGLLIEPLRCEEFSILPRQKEKNWGQLISIWQMSYVALIA